MVAAPKYPPRVKLRCGNISRADLLDPKERPMLSGKERTEAPLSRGGVRDPGDCTRIAEITSGKAVMQQGLATTCKDLKE